MEPLYSSVQEAFDATVKHLAKQKRKAYFMDEDGDFVCSYRTPDGLSCAIGCHIPDGHPSFSVVGDIERLFAVYPDISDMLGLPLPSAVAFWESMQNAHDRSDTVAALKGRLSAIASRYNIDSALIDTITEWRR